jgi:hypothetical protein
VGSRTRASLGLATGAAVIALAVGGARWQADLAAAPAAQDAGAIRDAGAALDAGAPPKAPPPKAPPPKTPPVDAGPPPFPPEDARTYPDAGITPLDGGFPLQDAAAPLPSPVIDAGVAPIPILDAGPPRRVPF